MNPGLVVKLRPNGPWRIGPDSGARNRVDVIYHSDSLYSAVTSAMARLGWLEDWLEATARSQAPAVSFSSCFPYIGETRFIVPPRTVWPPVSPSARAAAVRWKSARFVPLTVVQSILHGQRLDESQWSVDGPSDCLVPAGSPGPFRTAMRWSAAVDRLSGASERHSMACLEFRPGSGLWTVVSFADEAAGTRWSEPVQAAFRLLADSGFGGERSRGWGRAEAPEFSACTLPDLILPARMEAAVLAPSPVAPLEVEPAPEAEAPSEPEPLTPVSPVEEPPVDPETPPAELPPAGEPEPPAPDPEREPEPPVEEPPADPKAAAVEVPAEPPVEAPAVEPAAAAAEAPSEPEAPPAEPETAAEVPAVEPAAAAAEAPSEPEAPPAEPETAAEVPAVEPAAVAAEAPSESEAPPAEPETAAEPVPAVEPAAAAAEAPSEPEAPPAEPSSAETAVVSAETPAAPEPAPAAGPAHPHWLLSLFTPAPADAVDWRRGNYLVLARGGRVDSPAGSGELKKQIQMVAEGSVLYAESAPRGSAANVAPDGFPHPVFRAGFALAIPLPEVR